MNHIHVGGNVTGSNFGSVIGDGNIIGNINPAIDRADELIAALAELRAVIERDPAFSLNQSLATYELDELAKAVRDRDPDQAWFSLGRLRKWLASTADLSQIAGLLTQTLGE